MKNLLIITMLSLSFGTVTDIDGNVYETVIIGNQLWMAENLKVTHYNDETEIQYVQQESVEPNVWKYLNTGAYGFYNDDLALQETYGNLYNWFTVNDDRGVCPEGWHVASDGEFTVLTDYLGGTSVAGGKMKESGTEHWYSPNTGATNESGFTALPAGYRSYNGGNYNHVGYYCDFWSSSENTSDKAWWREMIHSASHVSRAFHYKNYGFSIRCLADEITTGCTNPEACNYDETANADDGSCTYPEDGYDCNDLPDCTYPEATNYNPDANVDDGSCEYLWGDMNHDGTLNVQDVIFLVNAILSGDWF